MTNFEYEAHSFIFAKERNWQSLHIRQTVRRAISIETNATQKTANTSTPTFHRSHQNPTRQAYYALKRRCRANGSVLHNRSNPGNGRTDGHESVRLRTPSPQMQKPRILTFSPRTRATRDVLGPRTTPNLINRALCCLTSEDERDPVHSTRYGRRRHQRRSINSCSVRGVFGKEASGASTLRKSQLSRSMHQAPI